VSITTRGRHLNCATVCADPALAMMLNLCIEQAGHRNGWRCATLAEAIGQCDGKNRAGDTTTDIIILDIRLCKGSLVADIQAILKHQLLTILLCVPRGGQNNDEIFAALANGATHVLEIDAEANEKTKKKIIRILQNSGRRLPGKTKQPAYERRRIDRHRQGKFTFVVIGASTGGPSAMVALLQAISHRADVAIVMVQHLDTVFSDSMSVWMDGQTHWPIRQAGDGEAIHGGEAILASGDCHWFLDTNLKLRKSLEDHGFFMPSIDTFMFSVVKNWHQSAMGVLLTGMGKDGAAGLAAMQNQGWRTFAQDEASSAVYGMPQAAVKLGAADQVLAPDMIGREIEALFQKRDVI